jgi:hypothetical protein
MIDSLSKIEQIHFKKDVSGFIEYINFLNSILPKIEIQIKYNSNSTIYKTELIRLKNYFEKEIKHTNKRIEMIK